MLPPFKEKIHAMEINTATEKTIYKMILTLNKGLNIYVMHI